MKGIGKGAKEGSDPGSSFVRRPCTTDGNCPGDLTCHDQQVRQHAENDHIWRATARQYDLLRGRYLLPGCSPHPGGAMEPRSSRSEAEMLLPACSENARFAAFASSACSPTRA